MQKLQPQRNACSLLLPCQSTILQDWILSHRETTCESERLYRNTVSRRFRGQKLCFFPTFFEACFNALLFIQYLLSLGEIAKETLSHRLHCILYLYCTFQRIRYKHSIRCWELRIWYHIKSQFLPLRGNKYISVDKLQSYFPYHAIIASFMESGY